MNNRCFSWVNKYIYFISSHVNKMLEILTNTFQNNFRKYPGEDVWEFGDSIRSGFIYIVKIKLHSQKRPKRKTLSFEISLHNHFFFFFKIFETAENKIWKRKQIFKIFTFYFSFFFSLSSRWKYISKLAY